MDYPNVHRHKFKGGAEAYTEVWTQRLHEARSAGIEGRVIAVIHPAMLSFGAEAFYRYFAETLGLTDFQVNTPFFGGPAKEFACKLQLDLDQLSRFLTELFDRWIEHGCAAGVSQGPSMR